MTFLQAIEPEETMETERENGEYLGAVPGLEVLVSWGDPPPKTVPRVRESEPP